MYKLHAKVAEHLIEFTTASNHVRTKLQHVFRATEDSLLTHAHESADLFINIEDGFGSPFAGFTVAVNRAGNAVTYDRADYQISMDPDFRRATVRVYDDFALKHALTNVYSSYMIHHKWGLLVHSSCVIEDGQAHLFAGHSGAGKSTVAALSQPRSLLSDEATIVRIRNGEVRVFDSPFRSGVEPDFLERAYPLKAIHLLHQATSVARSAVPRPDAVLQLVDKIFYWAHEPSETVNILRLFRDLVQVVPVYDLYFPKNSTFWEAIS